MSPEQITAIGGTLIGVLTALFGYFQTRQSRKVAALEERVGNLEEELAESKGLFREAVRFIRVLLSHISDLAVAHQLQSTPPAVPPIPERLREEV